MDALKLFLQKGLMSTIVPVRRILLQWHALCLTRSGSDAHDSNELARGAPDEHGTVRLPCPCRPVKPLWNVARQGPLFFPFGRTVLAAPSLLACVS